MWKGGAHHLRYKWIRVFSGFRGFEIEIDRGFEIEIEVVYLFIFVFFGEFSLHYAMVSLGTPSQTYMVALDTGSDLFWVPCDCIKCAPTSSATYGFVCPPTPLRACLVLHPHPDSTTSVMLSLREWSRHV